MKKVLVTLVDGFEELEAVAPIDFLIRAGAKVVLASGESQLILEGRNGVSIKAEMFLSEALRDSYDMILIPGGPGHSKLRKAEGLKTCIQEHAGRGKYIAAICSAPLVLKDCGLLDDIAYTGHKSIREELPELKEMDVVVSDNIITSRGAGTAILFALTCVEVLFGLEMRNQVGVDVHAGC